MEENQVMQNSVSQQPVQPSQGTTDQASVSMQIQQLLVQQQQYQQQYNQLVTYVKETPNLPIEQVNQIQQQLNQLNNLFVEGKQKLQALGYNPVQVNKPTEVKKGSKNNLSFRKLTIGCLLVVVLILVGIVVTVNALIKNPNALQLIGINANGAKTVLMVFSGLIFGSAALLMLGVVIGSIYKLNTAKNESRGKHILGGIGGFFGAGIFVAGLLVMMSLIGKIQVEEVIYDVIQPLINDKPYNGEDTLGEGENYTLIAPLAMSFGVRGGELLKGYPNAVDVVLICGNKQGQELSLSEGLITKNLPKRQIFNGSCLYGEKGNYTYSYKVKYRNPGEQEKTQVITGGVLNFKSEVIIYDSNNKRIYPKNGEFIIGEAPAQISIDSRQVFRDFELVNYYINWDGEGDKITDVTNLEYFKWDYNKPQVHNPLIEFPEVPKGITYSFPIRVEQSQYPVCELMTENHPGTTKYNIHAEWLDASSEAQIASYNYSIIDISTNKEIASYKDASPEITHEFPEKGSYKVRLDFITTDRQQSHCVSKPIQLKAETFNIQYSLLQQDISTSQYQELCSSNSSSYSKCTSFSFDSLPQHFQMNIKSITPSSNTTKKTVYLNDKIILNDNDTYSFDIYEEGTFKIKILVSDKDKGIEEMEKVLTFTVKRPDIIGNLTLTSKESGQEIKEGFEPLTVVLDASKTEINIPGDEIVYFTWDFGDGVIKRNQQNGVIEHTYNFDYNKERGIFTPKVTITTLQGLTKEISGPTINVKKGLVDLNLSSPSHPTRQIKAGEVASFQAEFDGLPESMNWDFGDGSYPTECPGRACTEVSHVFEEKGLYSVKLSLDFDAIQQVESVIEVKVY